MNKMENKNQNLRFRRFIVLVLLFCLFGGLVYQGVHLINSDHDRSVRVKLITQSLESYYEHFDQYPEKLSEIEENGFLKPIPVDAETKKPFPYITKKDEEGRIKSYEISIFQKVGQKKVVFKKEK